ncbi:hypothetical protein TI04_02780 [Achromatium sp. WMS2]|nr:hypothetical protein TI04_02780 [Achromatium sp. WMS2]
MSIAKFLMVILLNSAMLINAAPLPMEDLYGSMDEAALRSEINAVATASDFLSLKRLGIAWHNLAVLKASGASDQALEILSQANRLNPEDMAVLAYLGSAKTLVARDSWNFITKMSQTNKGIAMIDKAVRRAPKDPVVRMVRANNSLALPEFFGRRPRATKDFEYMHAHQSELHFPPLIQAEISYKLASLKAAAGDQVAARTLYQEAITVAPKSAWAQQAAVALQKLGR